MIAPPPKEIEQRPRRTPEEISRERHRSTEAREVGRCVNDVLCAKHGDVDWITQVIDVVELALDRAVRQLSASNVTTNAPALLDGATYAFPPRTADEIKETIAASERHVDAKAKIEDPRVMDKAAAPAHVPKRKAIVLPY